MHPNHGARLERQALAQRDGTHPVILEEGLAPGMVRPPADDTVDREHDGPIGGPPEDLREAVARPHEERRGEFEDKEQPGDARAVPRVAEIREE